MFNDYLSVMAKKEEPDINELKSKL